MSIRKLVLAAALGVVVAGSASAQTVITQASVLAGGITPGDAPGFPATLSVIGAYRLGTNLTPPPGTTAVDITQRNVSLDLAGHAIDGGNRCTVSSSSIAGNSCPKLPTSGAALVIVNRLPARIVNGSVIGGFSDGIYAGSLALETAGLHLADLDLAHHRGNGIAAQIDGVLMRNVTIQRNGRDGAILNEQENLVVGVNVSHNGGIGLRPYSKFVGENIVSSYNGSSGIETPNGSLRMADASFNAGAGIVGGLVASNVNASNNASTGMVLAALAHEVVASDNTNQAVASAGVGCYARIFVRTSSAATPQVSGDPLSGTITSCP